MLIKHRVRDKRTTNGLHWVMEASIDNGPFEEIAAWIDHAPEYEDICVAEGVLVNGLRLAFKYAKPIVPNIQIMNVSGLNV